MGSGDVYIVRVRIRRPTVRLRQARLCRSERLDTLATATHKRMGLFHHYIADNRNPRSWASRLRRARFARFREVLDALPATKRILDVGGTVGFWQNMGALDEGLAVTLLNRRAPPNDLPRGFSAIQCDARDMREIADRTFDLVLSSSVIEHVGTFDDQRRMADEIRRVGKQYIVQTPNRYFPIEPHFLLPLFQFYPQVLQVELTRRFALGWYARIDDLEQARAHVAAHRLLDARELRALFPEAVLHRERVAGLTKSFIAIGTLRD